MAYLGQGLGLGGPYDVPFKNSTWSVISFGRQPKKQLAGRPWLGKGHYSVFMERAQLLITCLIWAEICVFLDIVSCLFSAQFLSPPPSPLPSQTQVHILFLPSIPQPSTPSQTVNLLVCTLIRQCHPLISMCPGKSGSYQVR